MSPVKLFIMSRSKDNELRLNGMDKEQVRLQKIPRDILGETIL